LNYLNGEVDSRHEFQLAEQAAFNGGAKEVVNLLNVR